MNLTIQGNQASNVTPNPRSSEVMEGADKRENCNVIVAVGGGSPMDCAKGIGIVSSNNMNILRFEGVDKIQMPVPPLIFIPTTAGTSADVSQFCIIANLEERVKIAIVSKAVVPDVALIDPETTTTMDPYLTACTGVDALVHAIEAFVSTASGPLTDMHAIEAIKLVRQNLPALLKDQANPELREKIMLGSMKAGLAFSNAILGAVHAMAHSLGGYLDLPHGECNAMLLEHVINFNFDSAQDRFKIIAKAMGIDIRGLSNKEIKGRLMTSVSTLKNEVGITRQLGQKGVNTSDIQQLSKKAINDACLITNPRKATKRDIEVIYDLKKHYDFKLIEIKREYEAYLPSVPCEGAKIQQVLLNIFRNGSQAMQEEGTESPLFILRTRLEKDRNIAVIEIEDNGPGMTEATRKRVFEPFYTTKPVGVGTGLGLSVSYFIITENHGGEMAVESTPGSGAKFIIRLPLK